MIATAYGRQSVHVSYTGYYNINQSLESEDSGKVRYNFSLGNLEVHDGYSWVPMPEARLEVALLPECESTFSLINRIAHEVPLVVDWAKQKQREEAELAELAQSNPALADLVEELNTVKNKIKVVKNLISSGE